MRIGLAGAGRIGEVHFRTLIEDPRCSAVTVFDVDAARAEELAGQGSADVVTSVDRLLADSDALVVASPTPTHLPLLRAAVAQGLPTFCEKPIAIDSADVRRVSDEVASAGAVVQVGFHYRFDPALRELASVGWSGSSRQLRVHSTTEFAPSAEYLAEAGGLIADKLIHELDMVRWMTGAEPVKVAALTADPADAGGQPMRAGLLIQLTDGAIATVWGAYQSVAGFDLAVEREDADGVLVMGNRRPVSEMPVRVSPNDVPDFRLRFVDAYRAELEAFIEVARGERDNPCPLIEAVRTQLLVDACSRALSSGTVVTVPVP